MNRLILIGNGFDLAHNLKTSYKDFIEYLWIGVFDEMLNVAKIKIEREEFSFQDKNGLVSFFLCKVISTQNAGDPIIEINIEEGATLNPITITFERKDVNNIKDLLGRIFYPKIDFSGNDSSFSFSIDFFKIISQNYINKNWSDIEADYYKELLRVRDKQEEINELNEQFKQIKELLRKYLKSLSVPTKIEKLENLIYEPINVEDLRIGYNPYPINNIGLFPNFNSVVKDSITYLNNRFLGSIMFLNFNYTKTENLYKKKNIQVNHIHGSLDNSNDHMIFGYGDEEADEYKELEKSDNKGLLDNVKIY